ncbi:MAG: Rrf2 family transcriptional regulator [Pirellulales bacterium]|nr:Rrf2 family transcriptional regulator [Pirellulales bacterium]
MFLTAKAEYACLAMLELAVHYGMRQPVQVRRIAERHGIPSPFLVQILQNLKRAALITSTRGASGGYQLARAPEDISLSDVLGAVDGAKESSSCAATASPLAPVLDDVCRELSSDRRARLEGISLAQLVDRAPARGEPMWYI